MVTVLTVVIVWVWGLCMFVTYCCCWVIVTVWGFRAE